MAIQGSQWITPKYQPDYDYPVSSQTSIQVERRAQNADGEVSQMRSIIIELNPADHAMVFHILRDFRLR